MVGKYEGRSLVRRHLIASILFSLVLLLGQLLAGKPVGAQEEESEGSLPPHPPRTATPVPCFNSGVLTGSIVISDPVQAGRINRDGVASSCQTPKTCSILVDTLPRHYDAYTFVNSSSSASCYTVRIDAGSCTGSRYLFSTTYLGSFNRNNLCSNFLADIGISPNPVGSYSFTVPAGATFVVVVHEIDVNGGCPIYTLNVTNCQPGCSLQFSDVPSTSTFYTPVRCLACRGVISGYADGTFRPNTPITRGQLAKMVSNATGFNEPVSGQTFQDVPPSHTFYVWIQRLTARGFMSGYPCGGPGEPCVNNRPYFRPNTNATRAQTSKIVSNAAGFAETQTTQTFQDVPPSNQFYQFIQRLASRGIMGGYPCGGAGEPCVNNRPYFRPTNNVTRGQASKIVANTFFPGCNP